MISLPDTITADDLAEKIDAYMAARKVGSEFYLTRARFALGTSL